MENYQMITKEKIVALSPLQLREKYNDAVETIWLLQQTIKELRS